MTTHPPPRPLGGVMVLRDRRVVYASAGAAALAGRSGTEVLGRPILELLAPEERDRIVERHARLLRGEPVPAEYELALLLPDGGRRPVEVALSLEGQDEILLLRDLTERAERRRLLSRLADLGVAIQRERTEEAIQERVREGLFELGLSSVLVRPQADGVRVAWARLGGTASRTASLLVGGPPAAFLTPWTDFDRAVWTEGAHFSDDWLLRWLDAIPPERRELARPLTLEPGMGRAIGVRLDQRTGPTCYLAVAGDWLGPGDVPAVKLFGAQVAAALDSAGAIAELAGRNLELAALNRLGELAAGAVDLAELLPRAVEVVRQAAGCQAVAVFAADPACGDLLLVHGSGVPVEMSRFYARVRAGSPLGRVAAQGRLVVVQSSQLLPEQRAWLEPAGFRTFAYVPLVLRSRTLGVMVPGWSSPRTEAECRPELLLAMGSYFAAAMEADGLLGDLRRRVGELTLLNDVAAATATSEPALLLEDALRRVCETFATDGASAYLLEDGRLVQLAASGLSPETTELIRVLEPGEGPAGLSLARRRPVTEATEQEMGPRCAEARRREGFQAVVAVPLLAQDRAVGAICLGRRADRAFDPGEVRLLSAIGVQLGIAVDAARQHAEARRRAEELALLQEVGRSLVATLELPQVLEAGVRNLARIAGAADAALLLLEEDGETLRIEASAVPRTQLVGRRLTPAERTLTGQVLAHRVVVAVEDAAADPRVRTELTAITGARALLGLPLLVKDRPIGVALILHTAGPRRFADAEVQRAAAVANQLAVAVDHARAHAGVVQANADLRLAQERLLRQERLAALGELSALVAHEVRNPLGAIVNALGPLRRAAGNDADARMLLDIVGEEADRLNRIVGDLLDFARPAAPAPRPERLGQLVDDAVTAALVPRPPALEVVLQVDPALPPVAVDGPQVHQALVNLVQNAVQAMPRGGTLTVRVRSEGTSALVEVEDTGPGIPEDLRQRIFEPFFTTRAKGTGLGLSVVKRIVDGHGGEVSVGGRPGAGAVFTLRFPLLEPASADRQVERGGRIG